ncbi:phospholipase DDHD2-like isoform X2 [Mercenaria mercenaria]|uniref:phospholipase DDHD2-like isoform X2 n=1 Tax=Mercenaria mercenaria TaxID=6596 RepID=UPI00234F4A51|nr:phospholipase DDHD2-like isoform X2 [Mercenaria mercenaria]
MADRQKKEPTPPPLLLMPAGGGLTLTPPDQPSLYMPVIQSEPSLFGAEDEGLGEADSFVGQSPPPQGGTQLSAPPPSTLFQSPGSNTAPDQFAHINHSTPLRPPAGPPHSYSKPAENMMPPLAPTSQVPVTGATMSSVPPMPNASGLSGLYRKHGSNRYAQMPSGTYANSPANLMATPPAPIPFSQNFTEATASAPSMMAPNAQPATLPPKPSIGQLPGMGYVPNATGTYIPVAHHWCFCKNVEGRDIWYPLSMADNLALEDAFKSGQENVLVSTDGGRYDVNLTERRRYAVFWEEEPKVVQRCSWFYKREGDNRYVPYEETFALRLEEEYKTAVTSGVWHKPIQFESGESVVMHNPNVMVHYQPSTQPDEWGTVQGDQLRPRVVKRGVGDFESIDEGESRQVDHVVFVVHGVGSVSDFRFRSIVECVDDFRLISQSLLSSHFTQYVDSNRIGRVEFLPIHWHSALHGDATGIDKRIKAITLQSIAKLRNFVNDTLLDVLFYTSPTYCQCIADAVGREINRLYDLFLTRHPGFTGGVSVAGHSLGACILFDLLQHQADPSVISESNTELTNGSREPSLEPTPQPSLTSQTENEVVEPEESGDQSEEEESTLTLAELLSKVGLHDKQTLFEQEQIDMEALIMCSESDLKDLGLPMGPRKKLQGILKEEQMKKDKKQRDQERKTKQAEDRKLREQLAAEMAAQQQQQREQQQKNDHQGSSLTVDYLVGVGGTGQPQIKYTQLKFSPVCCFALGSPVGMFLSARGVETIGEDFKLPTCQKYFNIFHPFDPVAYRLEPLINPAVGNMKPFLMPHHKGRKRLHLELKESLARMGTDIKQKIVDSLKSTWTSINNFARAHQSDVSLEEQVASEMSQISRQLEDDDRSETASVTSGLDEDIYVGQLNEGRRVDYVLQERPIESFNDYVFSLTSHGCYWNSEDTMLLVLKEIYSLYGISPQIPGVESQGAQRHRVGPPPKGPPPAGSPYGALPGNINNSAVTSPLSNYGNSFRAPQEPPHMFNVSNGPPSGPPPATVGSGLPPLSGPPPFSMGQAPKPGPPMGPPPTAGFMKKS